MFIEKAATVTVLIPLILPALNELSHLLVVFIEHLPEHALRHLLFFRHPQLRQQPGRRCAVDHKGHQHYSSCEEEDLFLDVLRNFVAELDDEGKTETECASKPTVCEEDRLPYVHLVPCQIHDRHQDQDGDKANDVEEDVEPDKLGQPDPLKAEEGAAQDNSCLEENECLGDPAHVGPNDMNGLIRLS